MAAESNGRPVEPGQKGVNGHAMNGHAAAARKLSPVKKQKGFGLFSIILRLFSWYSIITILVRCPSTANQLSDTSSKICKPYFQLRSVVAPHLEPYYDVYAAPYVDAARPYYNTLDKKVITPVTALGVKYGAPRVAQAQAFGQAQWEKNLQPQVLKYQGIAKGKYDETLAPHVDTVIETTSPYYEIAKTNALQTYYEHILPIYAAVQPYVLQGYGLASDFTVDTAIPYSQWAWATGVVFLDRTVWPKLRILYGENVEPQLVRIGERLGRYRDGKKLKAAVEEIDISSSASSASETLASIASSVSSVHATTTTSLTSSTSIESSVAPENSPLSDSEIREKAKEIVANDLKTWQEKFAKAADEGSDELEDRISEITDRLVQSQAGGVGKAMIIELEETANSSFKTLKSKIRSIAKSSKEGDDSEEALNLAVRKAGSTIKEKAQAVRTWRRNYDDEMNSLVSKAAEDTFEIIDHIRDLGLQEIGMRWAWTDGITHKDWSKYHQLKTTFDEWRVDVENVATEHPGIIKARVASEEVENHAMGIAEDAANELARLKETGRWKLSVGDASEDFNTKYMPAAAANAGQKIIDKVYEASEAVAGTSQGTLQSVASVASSIAASHVDNAKSAGTDASKSASSVASSLSSSVIGTPQGSVESVASVASSSASSLADAASSSVIGTQQGSFESVASIVKESASSIADQASSSVIGTSQGSVESIVSVATESGSSISAKASSLIVGEEPGVAGKASNSVKSVASVVSASASSLSDVVSSSISSGSSVIGSASSSVASSVSKSASDSSSSVKSAASSTSSTASKKVWGGAMAATVEARKIIFEDVIDNSDDESFSEKLQSLASEAGDRYSDITRAVSEALLKPTETEKFPVTKLAASQYSSALAAASTALYGTEKGTGESVSSLVASRYAEAVSAASSIIYGTPIPVTDSIASQATDAYNSALSRASYHYAHARSLVSAQVSGKPKPVHEEMFSSVESAYSDSVNAASSRLQAALSGASTAVYGTPTPSYQAALSSASAVAQSKLSEGLRGASARYEDGKRYVDAINTGSPQKQRLLQQMREQFYAGLGMAHAQYSDFVEAASSAVMPTQTPFHQSLYNRASASIVGTPTPQYEAALSTASAHMASVIADASSQLDGLLSSITGKKKEDAPAASLAAAASSRYSEAISKASESYESVQSLLSKKFEEGASAASTAIIGSETPWTESAASAASENWEALITKASSQIYGGPTPYFVTRRLLSEVKQYAAQATEGAVSQYSAVQSLIGELVSGKEPDFTESVYKRLSSAYYTGAVEAASSASSYANAAYESASSAVSSVFTPPPTLEVILDNASSRVNDAVEAASIQFYGSKKGTYEQATEAASSAYSSVQSVASEKVYGSSTGYAEAAQSSISDAAASAQKAISEAIYGTQTGTYESATNVAADTYSTATSVIAENISAATSVVGDQYSSAQSAISSAIYGPEKGAVESAQARLSAAVESARVKLAEFAAAAGDGASDAVSKASEGVEQFASSVSSAVESATSRVRDEL